MIRTSNIYVRDIDRKLRKNIEAYDWKCFKL